MPTSGDRAFILRAIIAFKAVKAVFLFALAAAAFALRKDLFIDAARFVTWLGIDAGRPTFRRMLHIPGDRAVLIGIGSLLYGCVFAVEGWGLHLRKRWAEWLTVVVTASLIPFETYELVKHATIAKVITLVANIAIVIYLIVRRLQDR